MALTKTPISKFTTIIKDSPLNTGLNPIAELCYGKGVTRMLCYFDHTHVKKLIESKEFADISKLKHTLKITNAGSFDMTQNFCVETSSIDESSKVRASSFDLIFFLIPQEWDNGKGFDYNHNFFNQGLYLAYGRGNLMDSSKLCSQDGSNWYQAKNFYEWDEEGIYSNTTLSREYDNFSSDDGSKIIIGRQHFDFGNENIELDITEIFNKFIDGSLPNYGIGIAYSPQAERTETEYENYTAFLTHHTNTFFEPYVETIYDDFISDDRSNFILGKPNRLYLYSNIGGNYENLDELPKCHVNDVEYKVKQQTKGIYYINITLPKNDFKPHTMLFDTWSNIKYQGQDFEPIELDFTTQGSETYFNIGNSVTEQYKVQPSIYGIQNHEKIQRGDKRKLNLLSRIKYKKNEAKLVDEAWCRVYIKDGTREIDVIPFERFNKTFDENFIMIDTNILLPQEYFVDVKIKYNQEEIIHHNVLDFTITDNLNNKFV